MSASTPVSPPGTTVAGRPLHPLARGRLVALSGLYLVLLTWVVLFKLELPFTADDRAVKLVPFVSVGVVGASAPVEVVVNLLLFVPFGGYLGLLAQYRSWWRSTLTVAGTSVALEVAQYVLGVGRSDVTDVLVNTAGGLIGLGVVALSRRRLQGRTGEVLARVCLVGTALVLVAAALYVVGPVRFVHVRDAGPLATAAPGRVPSDGR